MRSVPVWDDFEDAAVHADAAQDLELRPNLSLEWRRNIVQGNDEALLLHGKARGKRCFCFTLKLV